jgi:HSP20 family protein
MSRQQRIRFKLLENSLKRPEDKGKNYVYNERSYRSFSRRIPIPEEIVPSKVTAKMYDGMLLVDPPKTMPTKPSEETTKVEIK